MTTRAEVDVLGLLDDVTWHGRPLSGRRTHALLATLTAADGRPVADQALVEAVWADDVAPTNPAKALQVVVSRTRSATGSTVVARTEHGYRLGLGAGDVDALLLRDRVRAAARAEAAGDLVAARDLARAALTLAAPPDDDGGGVRGPLRDLRRDAERHRHEARVVLGRALSGLGQHDEALVLLQASTVDDEPTALAMLRSLAAVRGAPVALEHYEQLRVGLAERLGVDPGPALRAAYSELLAADHPVRSGLRFDAASLVGRDDDLRALRGLVRQSRVVSILGPGGLGKTRLANLLAAEAEQSVVHVVELVGIAAAEDVVGEVGSALGVRDSLTGRISLTPEQRRDVRARIAQNLDQAPTLLVLDNCEHVVDAVADLVAYLVATVRQLRVVTTTRAPLAIAAERVFALGQLAEDDAVELFAQRARSARPGVSLDDGPDGAVRRVVGRLDGLPLAIELAAAKVRGMSVEDVDRRLDDRFRLLRGGDRSAPDRHQTLVAVIDWSWNLLREPERRSLRWLSAFHDGFTLAGAEALLGHDGGSPHGVDVLDDLQALVDQSMLTVVETVRGVRYRMLETVREFGRMQLVGAGEDDPARAAQQSWARELALAQGQRLWGPAQVMAVQSLVEEENNLSDCLRVALADRDPATVVSVVSALGWMWTIKGENTRVMAVARAVDEVIDGWEPPEPLIDAAVQSVAAVIINSIFGDADALAGCRGLLGTFREQARSRRVRGLGAVADAEQQGSVDETVERLHAIAEASAADDPGTAILARVWAAHELENAGDRDGSIAEAHQALALLDGHDDLWLATLTHGVLAAVLVQGGEHELAAVHARAALPGLARLGADDDVAQSRSVIILAAIAAGRLDHAREEIAAIEGLDIDGGFFGGDLMLRLCRAELALADGQVLDGLALYREAAAHLADMVLPGQDDASDTTPWRLAGESVATAAYARYGRGGPDDGRDLRDALVRRLPLLLTPGRQHVDYPMTSMALFAAATWELLHLGDPENDVAVGGAPGWSAEVAVRVLALAERLTFPRQLPSIDPALSEAAAEMIAPGLLSRARADYAELRGRDLLDAARIVLERR